MCPAQREGSRDFLALSGLACFDNANGFYWGTSVLMSLVGLIARERCLFISYSHMRTRLQTRRDAVPQVALISFSGVRRFAGPSGRWLVGPHPRGRGLLEPPDGTASLTAARGEAPRINSWQRTPPSQIYAPGRSFPLGFCSLASSHAVVIPADICLSGHCAKSTVWCEASEAPSGCLHPPVDEQPRRPAWPNYYSHRAACLAN